MLTLDSGESCVRGPINTLCHKVPREKEEWYVSVRSNLPLLRTFCYSSRFNASGSDKYMYSYNPCQTFGLGPPSNNSCYFRDVAVSFFDYLSMMWPEKNHKTLLVVGKEEGWVHLVSARPSVRVIPSSIIGVTTNPFFDSSFCLHGGRGPQVGGVTRLGGVTRISI